MATGHGGFLQSRNASELAGYLDGARRISPERSSTLIRAVFATSAALSHLGACRDAILAATRAVLGGTRADRAPVFRSLDARLSSYDVGPEEDTAMGVIGRGPLKSLDERTEGTHAEFVGDVLSLQSDVELHPGCRWIGSEFGGQKVVRPCGRTSEAFVVHAGAERKRVRRRSEDNSCIRGAAELQLGLSLALMTCPRLCLRSSTTTFTI
jgi:hypothetical protein